MIFKLIVVGQTFCFLAVPPSDNFCSGCPFEDALFTMAVRAGGGGVYDVEEEDDDDNVRFDADVDEALPLPRELPLTELPALLALLFTLPLPLPLDLTLAPVLTLFVADLASPPFTTTGVFSP